MKIVEKSGFFLFLLAAGACAPEPEPEPECRKHLDCSSSEKPYCEPLSESCAVPPRAHLIGWDDDNLDMAQLELVYEAPAGMEATSMDFRPGTNQMWVALRWPITQGRCTTGMTPRDYCETLAGRVAVVGDITTRNSRIRLYDDGNAWHFMRLPMGLTFGDGEFFVTCAESRTCNFDDEPADFAGPTLWTSDPTIFAINRPGQNGSHMDMLHSSPLCTGMAHEEDNVFWAFNGRIGSVDRYDFGRDHGPGQDDHTDGAMQRYLKGEVSRVANVASQMAFDRQSGNLYIADSGNGQILELDTLSGSRAAMVLPNFDEIQTNHEFTGESWRRVDGDDGSFGVPSGLVLIDDILYISDHRMGEITALDLEGNIIRRLPLPHEEPGLLRQGPEGFLYVVYQMRGEVYRIVGNPHDFR